MANLLLTQRCIRACPYCFAKASMNGSGTANEITWEDLIYVADLVAADGDRGMKLLGGEPTLHREFVDVVLYLIERGFAVKVFTSGVLAESRLAETGEAFADFGRDQLSFVCNLNDPAIAEGDGREQRRVERFLSVHGPRVAPGFNIYRSDFDLGFLVDLVNRFGLHRVLRLGLAHPIPGQANQHLTVADYATVAERLSSFLPLLGRHRIVVGLDCGATLCNFPDELLGRLFRNARGSVPFHCPPVIDIGPDLSVWSCFPLSSFHRRSLLEFDSLQAVREYYAQFHKDVRCEVAGVYEECDECRHRESGLCHGGCIAHSVSRFLEEHPVRNDGVYP